MKFFRKILPVLCVAGALSVVSCASSGGDEAVVSPTSSAVGSPYRAAYEAIHSYRYEECVELATAAMDQYGKTAEGLTLRGIAHAKLNHPHAAINDMLDVTRMEYTPTSLMNYGTVLRSFGYCARALDAYEHALAIDPENVYILIDMVSSHICLGEFDKANEIFNRAASNLPKNEITYTNAAILKYETQAYDEALVIVRKAIELNPNYRPAYKVMSKILRAQGDIKGSDEAIVRYNQIRGESPARFVKPRSL